MADPTVKVSFIGDDSKYKATLSSVEGASGKTGSIMTGVFQGVGQAAFGLVDEAGSKLVDFMGDSLKVANDDAVANTRLANALKNTNQAFDPAAIDDYVKSQEKLGFTSEDTQNSLSDLVATGMSLTDAQKTQAAAEDLARQHGLDLTTATKDLISAQQGRTQSLKLLGVELPKGATQEQILAAVMTNSKGAADAYAGTMSGAMATASAEVQDAQAKLGDAMENVGAAVIPVLVSGLETGIDAFENIIAAVSPFITQLGQVLGPVLAAIGDTLRNDVIPWISSVAHVVATVVTPIFQAMGWYLSNIVIPILTKIASVVLPILQAAFAAIGPIVSTVAGVISGVAGAIGNAFGSVASIVKGVVNTVIGVVNAVIRAIDSLQVHVSIPNPLGGTLANLDWNGVGIKTLPYFHAGGIVPGAAGSDVLAVLQAGERVVPRSQSGGGQTFVFNIVNAYGDGPSLDRLANTLARRLAMTPGT